MIQKYSHFKRLSRSGVNGFVELSKEEREAFWTSDLGGGDVPVEVLGSLENPVPMERRHVEGR